LSNSGQKYARLHDIHNQQSANLEKKRMFVFGTAGCPDPDQPGSMDSCGQSIAASRFFPFLESFKE
jgi:hypothetical protein